MLDYTGGGEPSVIYVDEEFRNEDRAVHRIADSFEDFLSKLIACPEL
jgi:hypothetical protein